MAGRIAVGRPTVSGTAPAMPPQPNNKPIYVKASKRSQALSLAVSLPYVPVISPITSTRRACAELERGPDLEASPLGVGLKFFSSQAQPAPLSKFSLASPPPAPSQLATLPVSHVGRRDPGAVQPVRGIPFRY